MQESEKEFFTLKDVAEKSGSSYGIVKRDIDRGILSAYRIGRKYFVSKDEMDTYVEQSQAKHGIDGYTIREIMGRIPLSYAFIMDLIKTGKLPAVKTGRHYVVPKNDFEEFIEDRKM